ncbi:MAG TPA: ABC transporter permease [Terracidiphilus sp.]|nr:ABC transporter permease [Terracidiphilus sp.]
MPLFRRVANLFSRRELDRDIAEELQAHLDLRIAESRSKGIPPEEARRAALLRFGNPVIVRERTASADAALSLDSFGFDVRYAFRQLCKSPGFSATVVLTLALGIGANAAIFSVVNAVLRHPAGVDHPEQVAAMHTLYTKFTLDIPYVSAPSEGYAASLSELAEAAALEQPADFNLLRGGEAVHVAAARVSSGWFRVFGAQPVAGRTFTAEEDRPSAAPVVVLSYGFWQRAFGGAADVVGKTLLLDGKSYRVLGVMRSDFAWPRRCEIWVPIALSPADFSPDNVFNESYQAFVRMRPGVTVQGLNAALSAKMWDDLRRLGGSKYAANSGWSIYATSLAEFAAGPLRKPLYVLMAVVALVLLIAAANVAGLFLARSSARGKEFAIQMALGAGTGRMIRQVFLEALILAVVASIAGAAAGPATGKLLLRMVPNNLAAGFDVRMSPDLVTFAAAAALLTLLVAGFGPAYAMVRRRGQLSLREGETHSTASSNKQRLRGAFVIGEVAAAFLLLAGTGLFLASLFALEQVDPGFNAHGVMTVKVPYAGDDFKQSQQRQAAFVGGVVSQLAAQPGMRAAAAVEPLPFDPDDSQSCSFGIVGRPLAAGDPGPHSQVTLATADYLKVMQIPLLAGRWIAETDTAATERVVVIDQRLAKKYWPDQNPIGQHISFACGGRDRPARIVGIAGTVRLSSLEEDTSDGMRYYAFAQGTNILADFLVRVDGDPMPMASTMKQAVAAVDPSQAVSTAIPLETMVADSLAGRRLTVWMLAAFAALALLLAMIGIYGLISFLTAQRTQEVGIRMALGAQRSSVLRLILGDALVRVAIGLAIGIAASVTAFALLRHEFADFGAGGLASLGAATIVLLLVSAVAGLVPAARAASVNPVQALRRE